MGCHVPWEPEKFTQLRLLRWHPLEIREHESADSILDRWITWVRYAQKDESYDP